MTNTNLKEFQAQMHSKMLSHAKDIGIYPKGVEPIYDGVCNIDGYIESPLKIMWLLKEAWEKEDNGEPAKGGWCIWECWSVPNEMNAMWQTMMYTMYGIKTGIPYNQMPSVNEEMLDLLKSSAYINISKMPGKTTSKSMANSYNQWRDILLEQINGYNPDIIIFGNTFDGLFDNEVFAIKSKSIDELCTPGIVGAYVTDGKLLVDAWHPSPLRKCSKPNITDDVYVDTIAKAVRGFIK